MGFSGTIKFSIGNNASQLWCRPKCSRLQQTFLHLEHCGTNLFAISHKVECPLFGATNSKLCLWNKLNI